MVKPLANSARASSLHALLEVLAKGRSLDDALKDAPEKDLSLIRFLVYGVLREYGQLEFLLTQLLNKPLKPKELALKIILFLGLFQLKSSRIPLHAAINETVELTKDAGYDYASGLVNAILRRFSREQAALLDELAKADITEPPSWLVKKLKLQYSDTWQQILIANNLQAPMHLRINRRKTQLAEYLNLLIENNIAATAHPLFPEAITLLSPIDVQELPQFNQGWVSVQDLAAQLAAHIIDLGPGQKVLDACAAPGGKTCHMLELCDIELTSMDISSSRLASVRENLERLGLAANLLCADASEPLNNFPQFDRILLDAPCSGTGVIRRHPDIKFLRKEKDIIALHEEQIKIIDQLHTVLKPNGLLLYATCSILGEENDLTIKKALERHQDLIFLDIPTLPETGAQRTQYGYQFLPNISGTDGFYYALLKKIDALS